MPGTIWSLRFSAQLLCGCKSLSDGMGSQAIHSKTPTMVLTTMGKLTIIGCRISGFGTVQWVDVKEYEALRPDKIAADGGEQNLKELNAIFSKPLKELLCTEVEIDDAAVISIDSKGTDIRVRQGAQFNIQRLPFEVEHGVEPLEEAKQALQKIIDRVSRSTSHNRS